MHKIVIGLWVLLFIAIVISGLVLSQPDTWAVGTPDDMPTIVQTYYPTSDCTEPDVPWCDYTTPTPTLAPTATNIPIINGQGEQSEYGHLREFSSSGTVDAQPTVNQDYSALLARISAAFEVYQQPDPLEYGWAAE